MAGWRGSGAKEAAAHAPDLTHADERPFSAQLSAQLTEPTKLRTPELRTPGAQRSGREKISPMNRRRPDTAKKILFEPKIPTAIPDAPAAPVEEAPEPEHFPTQELRGALAPLLGRPNGRLDLSRGEFTVVVPDRLLELAKSHPASIVVHEEDEYTFKVGRTHYRCDVQYTGEGFVAAMEGKGCEISSPYRYVLQVYEEVVD